MLKACFRRSKAKEEKEKRSPYANEEVAKIPKEEMMERIADVVKAESEKEKQEKGRDEGYKVGWVGSRSTKRTSRPEILVQIQFVIRSQSRVRIPQHNPL